MAETHHTHFPSQEVTKNNFCQVKRYLLCILKTNKLIQSAITYGEVKQRGNLISVIWTGKNWQQRTLILLMLSSG